MNCSPLGFWASFFVFAYPFVCGLWLGLFPYMITRYLGRR